MAKIITFGEIMLRLRSPEHERLFQSPALEATFGGSEANVAVSLAILGHQVAFASAVPDNQIGEAALRELRKHGVGTDLVLRKRGSRLGIYFLETGANQRPSLVVYDREGSAVSQTGPGDFDWPALLGGCRWFHTSGITPALSPEAAGNAIAAARAARAAGAEVSVDLNYRSKLWNRDRQAPPVMRELVRQATVVIANEEDIPLCLGIGTDRAAAAGGPPDAAACRELAAAVKREFPGVHTVAVTLRSSHSADRNGWGAVIDGRTGCFASRTYVIDDIVDRVGGGDSFGAGLIHGLLEFASDEQKAVDFAAAASCLKHSISGDFNLSTPDEIEALARGEGTGRVRR